MFTPAIDAGHPSYEGDEGCTAKGFKEKDYTLEIATALHDRLYNRTERLLPIMTRFEDIVTTFGERCETLDDFQPDFTLALHVDFNADPRVDGMRAYVLPTTPLPTATAHTILKRYGREGHYVDVSGNVQPTRNPVVTAHELYSNGNKHWTNDAWHVLNRYRVWNPLLIEMGFASNPAELKWLLSETGKKRIIDALEAGIVYAYEEHRSMEAQGGPSC